MARMTAARAAVEILKREGVRTRSVSGRGDQPLLRGPEGRRRDQPHPGPARRRRVAHGRGLHPDPPGQHRRLRRHVGTGRHRHDHRPLLGDRRLHPDPVHHRPGATGRDPQGGLPGRRHRLDRRAGHQDGDHRAGGRAGPRSVPAGLPPDALGPAGPGPHRPADRRPAHRDRVRPGDVRAAAGLQARRDPRPDREGDRAAERVGAPADRRRRRRHQRRRVRPARRVRRADRRSGRAHADGLGRHPRRPRAERRHGRSADLAPLRQRDVPGVRLRPRHRQPLGQPAHRQARRLHARDGGSCTSTSSPPRSAGSSPPTTASPPTPGPRWSCSSRWRRSSGGGPTARPLRVGGLRAGAQGHAAAPYALRQRADQAAAGVRGDEQGLRPRDAVRHHHRPLPDRRRADAARLPAAPLDQLRPGGPPRLDVPAALGVAKADPEARWSPSPATTTSSS